MRQFPTRFYKHDKLGTPGRYSTNREALLYNDYGHHCGYRRSEVAPVDGVDACCLAHDRCYDDAVADQCNSSWFSPGW